MAVIGSIVKIKGKQYFVSKKRHLGRDGDKLMGKFVYTLVDGESDEYTVTGKTISGNSKVSKKD